MKTSHERLISQMPHAETAIDRCFQGNIAKLAALDKKLLKLFRTGDRSIKTVSADLDGLADGRSDWSLWKSINLQLMRAAKPLRRNAVVTAARNEGPYIVEWVAHYKATGFNGVFIYTNNNTDHSFELLKLLHDAGEITLINNECGPGAEPQAKAYEHSLHFLWELREYEWVAYFDLDEFLVIDEKYDYSIPNFLTALRAKWGVNLPNTVIFNWDWYGSGGQAERGAGLVQDRFNFRKDYGTFKSMVHLPSISAMYELHIPDHHCSFVNSGMERVSTINYALDPPDYSGGRLNHYFHKSLEEYAAKKDRGGGVVIGHHERTFDNFFQWEPIRGVNGTDLGTPETLLSRVKAEMERLYKSVDGLRAAELECTEAHEALSRRTFPTGAASMFEPLWREAAYR